MSYWADVVRSCFVVKYPEAVFLWLAAANPFSAVDESRAEQPALLQQYCALGRSVVAGSSVGMVFSFLPEQSSVIE